MRVFSAVVILCGTQILQGCPFNDGLTQDPPSSEDREQDDPDSAPPDSDCSAECGEPRYAACSCAPSDPCGWRGDGFCDDGCQRFASRFDDAADCNTQPPQPPPAPPPAPPPTPPPECGPEIDDFTCTGDFDGAMICLEGQCQPGEVLSCPGAPPHAEYQASVWLAPQFFRVPSLDVDCDGPFDGPNAIVLRAIEVVFGVRSNGLDFSISWDDASEQLFDGQQLFLDSNTENEVFWRLCAPSSVDVGSTVRATYHSFPDTVGNMMCGTVEPL